MSLDYDNDEELKDSLEDFIYEILEESSPLLDHQALRNESKARRERGFEHISHQIKGLKSHASKLIDDLEKEVLEWQSSSDTYKSELEEATSKIEKLEKEIESLRLRIEYPEEYFGRKFGI